MKTKVKRVKCEMCGAKTSKIIVIKNRKNGNELKICQTCASEYGFIRREAESENRSI